MRWKERNLPNKKMFAPEKLLLEQNITTKLIITKIVKSYKNKAIDYEVHQKRALSVNSNRRAKAKWKPTSKIEPPEHVPIVMPIEYDTSANMTIKQRLWAVLEKHLEESKARIIVKPPNCCLKPFNSSLSTLYLSRESQARILCAKHENEELDNLKETRNRLVKMINEKKKKKLLIKIKKEYSQMVIQQENEDGALKEFQKVSIEDTENYISSLQTLKDVLKVTQEIETNHNLHKKAGQRNDKLIDSLDKNGVILNESLQNVITKIDQIDQEKEEKSQSLHNKVDVKTKIKESCQSVDDKVTDCAEKSREILENLTLDHIKMIRHKFVLRKKIYSTECTISAMKGEEKSLEVTLGLEGSSSSEGMLLSFTLIGVYQLNCDRILDKTTLLCYLNKRLGVIKKSYSMICDSLDNTRRSYIDSLRRNTVKVPEEQAERYHNLKDKQERRVINLMHNNKGFQKEIAQLETSLTDKENEKEFLLSEFKAFEHEVKCLSGDNNFKFDELHEMFEAKARKVQRNRDKLRDLTLLTIDINENIFAMFKKSKLLEAQILMLNEDTTAKEKEKYSTELRSLLQNLEERRYQGNYFNSFQIKIEKLQKKKMALHSCLKEINNQVTQAQNEVYYQSMMRAPRTPRSEERYNSKVSRSFMGETSSNSCTQLNHSPTYSTLSYKCKQFIVINPSQLELRNLISRSLRHKIKRLENSFFKLRDKVFKFLRDDEGNTYIQLDKDCLNFDVQESHSTYTWASTENIIPVHRFIKDCKKKRKRRSRKVTRPISPRHDCLDLSSNTYV
ncbi:unnamed protein product [Moneuplotes crassus]|uniref:Uncharacterized protein n=1 Tax=Euplotes crassus TaxID=5936 RepID=A0AAD1XMF2_EUPCR|nr:unnamed protein product [Moneuplotes crassus]